MQLYWLAMNRNYGRPLQRYSWQFTKSRKVSQLSTFFLFLGKICVKWSCALDSLVMIRILYMWDQQPCRSIPKHCSICDSQEVHSEQGHRWEIQPNTRASWHTHTAELTQVLPPPTPQNASFLQSHFPILARAVAQYWPKCYSLWTCQDTLTNQGHRKSTVKRDTGTLLKPDWGESFNERQHCLFPRIPALTQFTELDLAPRRSVSVRDAQVS